MNLGNLPGYYWDEDKQKYFKIQANHQVPTDAKYAKTSVKREDRAKKKRRIAQQEQRIRHTQTVKRASILQHSLLGMAGLESEISGSPGETLQARQG